MSQENNINESEQRYSNLVSNIPGAVYRCANDISSTMEYISPGIESLTGYPHGDFINSQIRTFKSIIHPEDRDHVSSTVSQNIAKKMPYSIEYRLITNDGRIKWVHEKGRAIFNDDGTVKCLDGVMLEITERVEAFEELSIFYLFAKHSSQGFLIASLNCETIYINRTLLKIINENDSSNVIGKPIYEYISIKNKIRFKKTIIPTVLKSKKWSGELEFISTDGVSTPAVTNMFLINDNKGNPLHICAILTDLKKHIEEEKKLNKKIKDLELFYKISIDRELKMIKLKKKIRDMEKRLNFFERKNNK